mmetsp:Transcript_25519/g.37962  ORF Transcript_25519/g.37962 Transcript_25519/m.37962 type:complete len:364 (-) Transcript_25519:665-1756(-)
MTRATIIAPSIKTRTAIIGLLLCSICCNALTSTAYNSHASSIVRVPHITVRTRPITCLHSSKSTTSVSSSSSGDVAFEWWEQPPTFIGDEPNIQSQDSNNKYQDELSTNNNDYTHNIPKLSLNFPSPMDFEIELARVKSLTVTAEQSIQSSQNLQIKIRNMMDLSAKQSQERQVESMRTREAAKAAVVAKKMIDFDDIANNDYTFSSDDLVDYDVIVPSSIPEMEITAAEPVEETASSEDEAALWKAAQEAISAKEAAIAKANEASLLMQTKLAKLQKAVADAKEAERIAEVKALVAAQALNKKEAALEESRANEVVLRAKQRAIRAAEGVLVEEGRSLEEIEEMESQAVAKEYLKWRVEERI